MGRTDGGARRPPLRLDHVVWLVDDLDRATADAADAGFTVVPGGTHKGGFTSNALIGFRDGAYVELLAFNVDPATVDLAENDNPLLRRFVPRFRSGGGIIDFCVSVGDLSAVLSAEVAGPFEGRRVRPDGVQLEWAMAFPVHPVLPFVIQDTTDRALRVPGGDSAVHENGALGLESVTISGPDAEKVIRWLAGRGGNRDERGVRVGDCLITRGSTPPSGLAASVTCADGETIVLR